MELTPLDCPACGHTNTPFGVVNVEQQYRCASCGMVYYGPAECADETDAAAPGAPAPQPPAEGAPRTADAVETPPEDWQAQSPATSD
jgi:hypothetical protein